MFFDICIFVVDWIVLIVVYCDWFIIFNVDFYGVIGVIEFVIGFFGFNVVSGSFFM